MVIQEGAAKSPFRAFRARDTILLWGELRGPFLIGLHDALDELGLGQAAFAVIKGDEHLGDFDFGRFFHGLGFGRGGDHILCGVGGQGGPNGENGGKGAEAEEPGFQGFLVHGLS